MLLKRLPGFSKPIFICFTVLSILLLIEFKYPYFFLQDDNRDYVLPNFIYNYRSLMSGELPLYNFHQFQGTPHLSMGQPGVLYIPAYISCMLSNLLFGHLFAVIDILVIGNLIIGALGAFYFLSYLIDDQNVAFFGAISWPLSSFSIYVSSCWSIVSPVVAFFPWMLLFSLLMYKKRKILWITGGAISRLFPFYAGHIQYFVYAVIFEILFIIIYIVGELYWHKRLNGILRFSKDYFLSYIFVLAFSLPLLLPMIHQTSFSAFRKMPLSLSEFLSFHFPLEKLKYAIFYPFVDGGFYFYSRMQYLSYIGYIPIIIICVGIIKYIFINKLKMKEQIPGLVTFILLAIITFVWMTSRNFNAILYYIPIINRFRWPFKLAIFLDFFLIIITSIVLLRLISWIKVKLSVKRIIVWIIIVFQIINLSVFYLMSPHRAFAIHKDTIPLNEEYKQVLADGRAFTIEYNVWGNNGSVSSLGFNYATLFGLYHFTGYCDPLILDTNFKNVVFLPPYTGIFTSPNGSIPIDHLRNWGVKWYVIAIEKVNKYETTLINNGISEIARDNKRVIYRDDKAYPFTYYLDSEENIHPVESTNTANKIIINADFPLDREVILNYLYNPFFKAQIDGISVSIKATYNNKMVINIPEGKHTIIIEYMDPYFVIGSIITLSSLIILSIFVGVHYIFNKRKEAQVYSL